MTRDVYLESGERVEKVRASLLDVICGGFGYLYTDDGGGGYEFISTTRKWFFLYGGGV